MELTSIEDTFRLASRLVAAHAEGGVLALHGGLGSGKTTLVQGLALALGIREPVTSPTFSLVNVYDSPAMRLIHMDLYRIGSPDELWTFDFDDLLAERGALVAIEWAERAGDGLPPHTRHVCLNPGTGPRSRLVRLSPPLP